MDAFDDDFSLNPGIKRSNRSRPPSRQPPGRSQPQKSGMVNQRRTMVEDEDDEIEIIDESFSQPRGRSLQRKTAPKSKPQEVLPRYEAASSVSSLGQKRQSAPNRSALRENNPFAAQSRSPVRSNSNQNGIPAFRGKIPPPPPNRVRPIAISRRNNEASSPRDQFNTSTMSRSSVSRPAQRRNSLDDSFNRSSFRDASLKSNYSGNRNPHASRGTYCVPSPQETPIVDSYVFQSKSSPRQAPGRKSLAHLDSQKRPGGGFQGDLGGDSEEEEIIQSGRLNESRMSPKVRPIVRTGNYVGTRSLKVPAKFTQNGVTYVEASLDGPLDSPSPPIRKSVEEPRSLSLLNSSVVSRNSMMSGKRTNVGESQEWAEFEISVFARLATVLSQSVEGTLVCDDCGDKVVRQSESSEIMTESVRGEFKKLKESVYDHIFMDHMNNKAKRYRCMERASQTAFSDARGHMKRWHPKKIAGDKGFLRMFYPEGCIVDNFPALAGTTKLWLNKCFPEFPSKQKSLQAKPKMTAVGRTKARTKGKHNDSLEVLEEISCSKPVHSRSKKTVRRVNDTSPGRNRQIREMSESPEPRVPGGGDGDNDMDILSALYNDGADPKQKTRSSLITSRRGKSSTSEPPSSTEIATATIKVETAQGDGRRQKPSRIEFVDLDGAEASQNRKTDELRELYEKMRNEMTNTNLTEPILSLQLMVSAVVEAHRLEEERRQHELEEEKEINDVIEALTDFLDPEKQKMDGSSSENSMANVMQTLIAILRPKPKKSQECRTQKPKKKDSKDDSQEAYQPVETDETIIKSVVESLLDNVDPCTGTPNSPTSEKQSSLEAKLGNICGNGVRSNGSAPVNIFREEPLFTMTSSPGVDSDPIFSQSLFEKPPTQSQNPIAKESRDTGAGFENLFSPFETNNGSLTSKNIFEPSSSEGLSGVSSIFTAPEPSINEKLEESLKTPNGVCIEAVKVLKSILDQICPEDPQSKIAAPEKGGAVKKPSGIDHGSILLSANSNNPEIGTPAADLLEFSDCEVSFTDPIPEEVKQAMNSGKGDSVTGNSLDTSHQKSADSTQKPNDVNGKELSSGIPSETNKPSETDGAFKEVFSQGEPKVMLKMLTGSDLKEIGDRYKIDAESIAKYGPAEKMTPTGEKHADKPQPTDEKNEAGKNCSDQNGQNIKESPDSISKSESPSTKAADPAGELEDSANSCEIEIIEVPTTKVVEDTTVPSDTQAKEKGEVFSVPVSLSSKRQVFSVPVVPQAPEVESRKIAGKDIELMRKLKKVFSIKLKRVLPKLPTPPPPPPIFCSPPKPEPVKEMADQTVVVQKFTETAPEAETVEKEENILKPMTELSEKPDESSMLKPAVDESATEETELSTPDSVDTEENNLPILRPCSVPLDDAGAYETVISSEGPVESTKSVPEKEVGVNVVSCDSSIDSLPDESVNSPAIELKSPEAYSSSDEKVLEPIEQNKDLENNESKPESTNNELEKVNEISCDAEKRSEAVVNPEVATDEIMPQLRSASRNQSGGNKTSKPDSSRDEKSAQPPPITQNPTKSVNELSEVETTVSKPIPVGQNNSKRLPLPMTKVRQQFYSTAAAQKSAVEPPLKKQKLDASQSRVEVGKKLPAAPQSTVVSKAKPKTAPNLGAGKKQSNAKLPPKTNVNLPVNPLPATVSSSSQQLTPALTKTEQAPAKSASQKILQNVTAAALSTSTSATKIAISTPPPTEISNKTPSEIKTQPQGTALNMSTPIAVSGPRPSTGRNLLAMMKEEKATPTLQSAKVAASSKAAGTKQKKQPPKSRGRPSKSQQAAALSKGPQTSTPLNHLPKPKPLPPLPTTTPIAPGSASSGTPESTPSSSEEASPAGPIRPTEQLKLNRSNVATPAAVGVAAFSRLSNGPTKINASNSGTPSTQTFSRSSIGSTKLSGDAAKELAMKKLAEKGLSKKVSPTDLNRTQQQKPMKGKPIPKPLAPMVLKNVAAIAPAAPKPVAPSKPSATAPQAALSKKPLVETQIKKTAEPPVQKTVPAFPLRTTANNPSQEKNAVAAGIHGLRKSQTPNCPQALNSSSTVPPKHNVANVQMAGQPAKAPLTKNSPQPSAALNKTQQSKAGQKRKHPGTPEISTPQQTTVVKPPVVQQSKPKFVLPKKVCPNYVPPGSEEESPKTAPKPVETYKTLLKQTVAYLAEQRAADRPAKCIFEKCNLPVINKLHETNLESHILAHVPIKVRFCPRCDMHFHLLVAHLIQKHPGEKENQWKDVRSVIEDNRKHHEAELLAALKACFPIPPQNTGSDSTPSSAKIQKVDPTQKSQPTSVTPQTPVPLPSAKPQPACKEPLRFKEAVFNKSRRQEQIRQKGGAVHCRHKNCEMRKKNTSLSEIQMELHIMAHFPKSLYFCAKCNKELKLPLEHLKVNHQDVIKQNVKPSDLTWIKDLRLKHEDGLIALLELCFPEDPETKRLKEKFAKVAKEGETRLPKEEAEKKKRNKRKTKEEKEASISAVREIVKRRKIDSSFSVEGPEAEKTLRKLTEERLPIYTRKLNEVAAGFKEAGKGKGTVQCYHCDTLLKGKARGAHKDIEKHVQNHFPKIMFECKECGAQIKNVPAHIAKEHESSEVELEDLRSESEMIENLSKCFPDLISPDEGGYMDQLPEELDSQPVSTPTQPSAKVSLPEFLLNDNIPETSLDHLLK